MLFDFSQRIEIRHHSFGSISADLQYCLQLRALMSYIEQLPNARLITDKSCSAGTLGSVFDLFIDKESGART